MSRSSTEKGRMNLLNSAMDEMIALGYMQYDCVSEFSLKSLELYQM